MYVVSREMVMRVFCTSPWIPMEWIKAHGFNPRGVWSSTVHLTGAVAEGLCVFARQLTELPTAYPDAAVVFTTACDQMRRAADAACGSHPRVFLLNLPATWQQPAVRRLYLDEVERLGRFLVRLGGRAPADEQLEAVLVEWDRRRQRLRELLPQASSKQAAEMLLDFFQDSEVPDMALSRVSQGVPLALVGGPLLRSQLDLFDAVESAGGRVVLNATEPGERCLLPPLPSGSGKPWLAVLADHYFEHCVDVFQRPNSRLYAWLRARLTERGVRGIVLWVRVGCDLWRAEALSLREAFGLPVLILDEHETRNIGLRDLTRLGAFIESLR